jgi:hypothetical protein
MYAMVQTNGRKAQAGCEKDIKGNLWTGSAWAGEETVVDSDTVVSACIAAVPDSSDNIHLTFELFNLYPTKADIYYSKRTSATSTWSAPEAVDTGRTTNAFPGLCKGTDKLYLVNLYYPTAGHVYYRTRSGAGVWDASATDWFTASADTSGVYWIPAVSDRVYNGKILLMYPTGTSSPYSLWFATLDITEAPAGRGFTLFDIESSNIGSFPMALIIILIIVGVLGGLVAAFFLTGSKERWQKLLADRMPWKTKVVTNISKPVPEKAVVKSTAKSPARRTAKHKPARNSPKPKKRSHEPNS